MIRAILTDIEGTTSSIDFVHQTLFPYAKQRMRAFLRAHGDRPEVGALLHDVAQAEGRQLAREDAADVLARWIDEDRKATPLKALQGMIWAEGYEAGELKGHVYPDTPEYLARWKKSGVALYVYSSGSVEAQKLIFGHTDYGDLQPLFSGYFDTRIGAKKEKESYVKIRGEIGFAAQEILFLSDVGEELDAARSAGMKTCQLLRDAKAKPSAQHPHAKDFSEVAVG